MAMCIVHKLRLNERASMRTNIDIDDALIDEVMKVANVKTKKEAVHLALQEFLKAKKKKDLFDLAGKIDVRGQLRSQGPETHPLRC